MRLARIRRPTPPPSIRDVALPAPVGGLNAIDAGGAMPPTDCCILWNMIAAEYGLRARLGYRQWVSGLTGASDTYVRSVLPFTGASANGAANKLFATTSSGIWDVTSSLIIPSAWTAATAYVIGDRVLNDTGKIYIADTAGISAGSGGPTGTGANIVDGTARWDYVSTPFMLAFLVTSGRAGHGVHHVHVTSGGHFLLYWDEVNGLHVYTPASGWAAVTLGGGGTQISGVDPANLVFGTVFKGRVWHAEKDSARLWYSGIGAIYGAHTQFGLSTKFKAGGPTRGLWSWTYDGGSGIDDSLVAVSDGGDVVVYQGTDPSSANTFGIMGSWAVGALPAGREIATDFGGELLLLTRLGILPLSKLVVGQSLVTSQYATAKISPLFNAAMLSKATTNGWSMRLHPEEGALIVTVPEGDGIATTQFAMSFANRSWSRFRGLPIYSSATHEGKFYFGTVDGGVYINDGYIDGLTLAAPTVYTPVQFSGIGSFQNLGSGRQKQVQFIRPRFLGQGSAPTFDVAARYDFDLTELNPVSAATARGSVWDTAVWDTAVWGGDFAPTTATRGACGMGANVALAWRGVAVDRTVLAGFEVGFTVGGY